MLERIYSRVEYIGRKREFGKHTRSDQRIQERISLRHGRYSKTRMQKRNIQKRRIARKVHGKKTIQIVRQEI